MKIRGEDAALRKFRQSLTMIDRQNYRGTTTYGWSRHGAQRFRKTVPPWVDVDVKKANGAYSVTTRMDRPISKWAAKDRTDLAKYAGLRGRII